MIFRKTALLTKKMFEIRKPDHVLRNNLKFNVELCNGLLSLCQKKTKIWKSYEDSIIFFNLANTDDNKIPEHQEIVMLLSSMQRLLNCNSSKVDEISNKMKQIFQPTKFLDYKQYNKFSKKDEKQGSTVADIWLRDFCNLRNDYAHGKKNSKKQCAWNKTEHLLFCSYILPLLLKCCLKNDDFYLLTDDDLFNIDIFETLLVEKNVFEELKQENGGREYVWDKTRKENHFCWHTAQILSKLQLKL